MAKGKSSASSATRKKHAAKKAAAGGGGEDHDEGGSSGSAAGATPPQRGQKKVKKSRFEPKVKSYIPPPPPPKGAPDPVDLYLNGGAGVDPELVVVLRRLGKRDEATISKGIEGLEACIRENVKDEGAAATDENEEWKVETRREELVTSMAVWAHHFPRLALHPSRRLRVQVHQLHALLTSTLPSSQRRSTLLSETRTALLSSLWLDQPDYVGSWCASAFDADRAVRTSAKRAWDSVVLLPSTPEAEEGTDAPQGVRLTEHAEALFNFASRLALTVPTPESASDSDEPSLVRTQALLMLAYLLGALPSPLPLPEESTALFAAPELWDLVASENPASLRRAAYDLLGAVVEREEKILESVDAIKVVAGRVMRHCWAEEGSWAGVISFLRRYPEAWTLADAPLDTVSANDRSPSDSEDEDSDVDVEQSSVPPPPAPAPTSSSIFSPSPTLSLFFTHLSLACSGHAQSYPTLILLLSTIPSSVLPATHEALSLLFESFWAAWGGRALSVGMLLSTPQGQLSPVEEFVKAFLECLLWEQARVLKEDSEEEVAIKLGEEWILRLWKTVLGLEGDGAKRQKGIATRRVGDELASALAKLATKSEVLFEKPWTAIRQATLSAFVDSKFDSLPSLVTALEAFSRSASEPVKKSALQLSVDSVKAAALALSQQSTADSAQMSNLFDFISSMRPLVSEDKVLEKTLDDLALTRLAPLLGSSALPIRFPLTFLSEHLAASSSSSEIWRSVFLKPLPASALSALVEAVADGALSASLPSANIDELVLAQAKKLLGSSEDGSEEEIDIVMRLVVQPHPFIDPASATTILDLTISRLSELSTSVLQAKDTTPLSLLTAPTRILAHFLQVPSNAHALAEEPRAVVAVFEVACVLPECRLDEGSMFPIEAISAAQVGWASLIRANGDQVAKVALEELRKHLVNPEGRISPIQIVNVGASLIGSLSSSSLPLSDILPSSRALDDLQDQLSISRPSPALAVVNPLISQASQEGEPAPLPVVADFAGLGSYTRVVLAILEVSARDQRWARKNFWILPHILLVGEVARDELSIAGASGGVFGKGITEDVLARIVSAAEGLSSYSVSTTANEFPANWHEKAVAHVRSKTPGTPSDEVVAVLEGLARRGKAKDAIYARRAFATILQATLRYTDGTVVDAERWLAWGQNLPEGSDLSCAVVSAVKSVLVESPRFVRYQNQLAADLSGVPSSASARGVAVLRVLLATAPPLDAPIIFLPQQRAMNLIQRIQSWYKSDDDLEEEIHSAAAELLLHLAPIVQDLSGSHWDLVFDIVESNLETAAWDDPASLPALYHSCRLLAQMKDLASTNAELRSMVKSRIDKSLELVRDLFVSRPESGLRNLAQAMIVAVIASLSRDLPPKLLSMGASFDQLIRLYKDPSLAVQLSSYDLVSRITTTYVSDLVVELELDSDSNTLSTDLPPALVQLISVSLVPAAPETSAELSQASTFLLSWLTVFHFFDNASPRLKSGYVDQLRRLDLIGSVFIPSLFTLLSLTDRTRAFDVSSWQIEEFRVELIDTVSPNTLPVFAAFVYYRSLQALPSLVRSWWESCKNRQLSMAVSTFTSKYFSPVLIARELAHLRDPDDPAAKALRDNDDFSVKVAAGANEVKAVFVVDEQNMEIGIKLPNEYPLQGVEVKDVKKIGVTDAQWRAWLLAVQQVMTTQNGLIADALSLFKRNVTLHFEGVEACAICYSVISVVDRTLPTKACRTCNNRFHSGCLFKWFSTSHSSSCPLCRSLF